MKFKEFAEFNEDQAKCKVCFNHRRSWNRFCSVQDCEDQVQNLEQKDPNLVRQAFLRFCKERDAGQKLAQRTQNKLKVMTYVEEVIAQHGRRVQHEGEMLWEGEWLEFAKTPNMGFLSRQEAEAKWHVLAEDAGPSVRR